MDTKYKTALKKGYHYQTVRGMISTEDLFVLPLTGNNGLNLDEVAQVLAAHIEAKERKSFVKQDTSDPSEPIKLEIVKDIISDKLKEKEERLLAKEKAERKQKILEILSRKNDASLEAKSPEELMAELEALG